ncbi:MAG: YybH family protein [Gemmatimonadota bacterium]
MRSCCVAGALALTLLVSACWIEDTSNAKGGAAAAGLSSQIGRALEASARAWNAGHLDGFLDFYQRAPTTTYVGRGGLVTGYEEIRAHYAPLFEPGAERDSLRFDSLRTRRLGPLYALATARYTLYRNGMITSTGPFTLVLRRVEGGWRIIHDHSSADPEAQSSR